MTIPLPVKVLHNDHLQSGTPESVDTALITYYPPLAYLNKVILPLFCSLLPAQKSKRMIDSDYFIRINLSPRSFFCNFSTVQSGYQMKVNEVPQDPKDFKEGDKIKKLLYAVDKDGKYTGVSSAGWDAENAATKQAWDLVEEDLQETEEKVKAGSLSPLAWYMKKNLMDTALLARYVGKWQWQVRRHFNPAVFKKLPPAMLEKYAAVFNITVDELKSFAHN